MRSWRIADADWNHWPDGLGDGRSWPVMSALGVQGVEVGIYDVRVEASPARVAGWDALEATHGLPVVALLLSLPVTRWPRGALTAQPEAVASLVHSLAAICARRGLPVLGLWPGADPPEAPWEHLVEGLTLARDVAASTGTRIAVEYKPGTAVETAADALRLAGDVPGTGVLLDTGHAWAGGEDPAEVARRLGGLLWHVHLGDAVQGQADDDLPVGHVHDFGELVRTLDEIGYEGVAAFDLYGAVCSGRWTGAGAVRESLAYLRKVGV